MDYSSILLVNYPIPEIKVKNVWMIGTCVSYGEKKTIDGEKVYYWRIELKSVNVAEKQRKTTEEGLLVERLRIIRARKRWVDGVKK